MLLSGFMISLFCLVSQPANAWNFFNTNRCQRQVAPFEEKKPGKADLPVCRDFAEDTCCSRGTTLEIRKHLIFLSRECRELTEKGMCAVCDPLVGTGILTTGFWNGNIRPIICPEFCEEWFGACGQSFGKFQTNEWKPCDMAIDPICGRLEDSIDTAEEFCRLYGFEVYKAEKEYLTHNVDNSISMTPCFSGDVTREKEEPSFLEQISDFLESVLPSEFSWKSFNSWLSAL